MPEFFTILIKVNIALVLFCLGYYLVLRKLTFYTLNRAYLVTGILFSSAYPFIDLSELAQRHQDIVAPVQNIVIYWKAPAEKLIKEAAYWNWLEMLFWTGALVFALRLAFQLISLYRIYSRSTEREINGQTVRVVKGDISPFSFWQSIYVNPEKLSAADLQNILEHEQIHVTEWHTLDVLLTEISVIFYWFNPGIWMMKKAVRENIEFITDRKILQKGLDSKAYQYSLLNITFNQPAPAITSNFNFSTLKKRIMMMNAKRSSNLNLTRYAFLLPVVVVCLFTFSLSKAEVVKHSPAFKAVAAAIENIKQVALSVDTTPVKTTKTQTKTVTGTNKAVTVTTDKNAQNNEAPKQGTVVGALISNNENAQFTLKGRSAIDTPLVIVDGKIFTSNINKIDPNTITTVSVFKNNTNEHVKSILGSSTTQVDAKAKNGVIVITTTADQNGGINKNADETSTTNTNRQEVVVQGYKIKPDDKTSTTNTNVQEVVVQGYKIKPDDKTPRIRLNNLAQPAIIVDGKIATEESWKQIDADLIESMVVLKSSSAVQLYGEQAKNGAIIITTKKK